MNEQTQKKGQHFLFLKNFIIIPIFKKQNWLNKHMDHMANSRCQSEGGCVYIFEINR